MVAPTDVVYLHSELPNAPQMNGTAGSRLAVLLACLVNGWGVVSLTGLVVSGGIATASVASHSFEPDVVALLSGGTGALAAVNGRQRVTSTATGSFSFQTGLADGTYVTTGITAKIAPAGWMQEFSGSNLAVFKSAVAGSTGFRFRVDDSAAKYAAVAGYESMTDVNTGVGRFPTIAQGNGFVIGSSYSDASPRRWVFIADSKFFYFFNAWSDSFLDIYSSLFFGDFVSKFKTGDAYSCIFSSFPFSSAPYPFAEISYAYDGFKFVARSFSGMGSSVKIITPVELQQVIGYGGLSYPNGPNNGLQLRGDVCVVESSSNILHERGIVPGFYQPKNNQPLQSKDKVFLPNGNKAVVLKVGSTIGSAGSIDGRIVIDIYGPWR
jgi:hypothetical protein